MKILKYKETVYKAIWQCIKFFLPNQKLESTSIYTEFGNSTALTALFVSSSSTAGIHYLPKIVSMPSKGQPLCNLRRIPLVLDS
jgi:hypothetical protein